MIIIENSRNDYVGDGSAATYNYTFKVFSADELKVTQRDDDGVETTPSIFGITGVGSKNGGTISLTDGNLPVGFTLTIERAVEIVQEFDIRNQGDYYPEYIEDALDYQVMISQYLKGILDRALKVSETTDLTTFDTTLPTVLGANRTVVVNEFGTALAAGPTIQELSDAGAAVAGATAAAAAALVSQNAAAASATAASASATSAMTSATAASGSATAAATSETAAELAEINAAASAATAAAHDLLYGSGVPAPGLGVDGNSYIDSTTGSFYQKSSGAWTLKVVLTGSAGVSSFNGRAGTVLPVAGDYTKADVGLSNVDNTSDASKPVSTAQAAADALNLKIANDLSDLSNAATARTNLGLGSVDNTTDLAKPISTATQTALNLKADAATVTSDLALKANLAGGNTFTGTQTFAGDLITQAYLKRSFAATVVAFATGGQASATQITKDVNRLTTVATNGDSVKLPAGTPGMEIFIQNDGVANANIFPATGEFIDAGAANAAVSMTAGSNAKFICVDTGIWKSQAGSGGGGTSSPLTTKGDLYVFTTVNARLPIGANDTVLTADSTTASGMAWKATAATYAIRAGVQALALNDDTKTVTFSTALASTVYSVDLTLENLVDANPLMVNFIVTAKTTGGFTYKISAPADSANYSVNWKAMTNV